MGDSTKEVIRKAQEFIREYEQGEVRVGNRSEVKIGEEVDQAYFAAKQEEVEKSARIKSEWPRLYREAVPKILAHIRNEMLRLVRYQRTTEFEFYSSRGPSRSEIGKIMDAIPSRPSSNGFLDRERNAEEVCKLVRNALGDEGVVVEDLRGGDSDSSWFGLKVSWGKTG